MRKGCHNEPPHVVRFVRSFPGAALLTSGVLFRGEYAFVDRASLLNMASPFEVTLRDKLHNFTHVRSKMKTREKCSIDGFQQQLVLGRPHWKSSAHHK